MVKKYLRIFAATLFWHIDSGAFQHFQQGLLHSFSTHISCDADVIVLDDNLVNLQCLQDVR